MKDADTFALAAEENHKAAEEAKDAVSSGMSRERELLVQLLNCYAPENAPKLTEELLQRYKNLRFLCEMPGDELAEGVAAIPEMPEDAVWLFANLHEILRCARLSLVKGMQLYPLCNAREYILAQLFLEKREQAMVFLLDREYCVIEQREINDGGTNAVEFDFGEMADSTGQSEVCFAIIAHNHPSGGKISLQDDAATKQALGALSLLGIPLLDHLVVCAGRAVSMRELGRPEESLWMGQADRVPSREAWLAAKAETANGAAG